MRLILIGFLATVISFSAKSQRIVEGDWLGTLDVGVKLRLVVHITKDASGLYTGSLDSPDQGAKGIPASLVVLKGDSLHLSVEMIKGSFDGLFINDTTISGAWSQGMGKAALTIVKTKEEVKINRPQTPKPPFNYKSEDVEYDNADKSVHFGGTLTYPSSGKRFPVAIMITGSGQQDRDETLFEHKPFAVIADYLTKRGFAVLRVDDRGIGKTTGDVASATSDDFAKDVEAGIAYVKSRPEIDPNKLGLIGHSEGGLIAEIIGAKRKDINFMVLMAAPGIKGSEVLSGQALAVLESQGVPSKFGELYQPFYEKAINYSITETDTAVASIKLLDAFNSWKKPLNAESIEALGIKDEATSQQMIRGLVQAFSSPWMKYFLKSNGASLLAKTTAKVLAINGELDVQVLAKPNIAGIRSALQKSKSPAYETRIFPGLNHLFQKCSSCSIAEYATLEETISPEVLTTIGGWLQKHVQQ